VHSIDDFLVRRTALSWRSPAEAYAAAPMVAKLLGSELGWTRDREKNELAAFMTARGGRIAART